MNLVTNMNDVKIGMIVTFIDGPGQFPQPKYAHPGSIGRVYGIEKDKWGTHLRVKMNDYSFQWVSSLSKIGIGAYCHA